MVAATSAISGEAEAQSAERKAHYRELADPAALGHGRTWRHLPLIVHDVGLDTGRGVNPGPFRPRGRGVHGLW